MVGTADALEADVAVGLHTGQHIGLSVVVERLDELLRRAAHVSEMDEEDFVLLAEVTNDGGQVIGHQREVAHAQGNAVDRTGDEVE